MGKVIHLSTKGLDSDMEHPFWSSPCLQTALLHAANSAPGHFRSPPASADSAVSTTPQWRPAICMGCADENRLSLIEIMEVDSTGGCSGIWISMVIRGFHLRAHLRTPKDSFRNVELRPWGSWAPSHPSETRSVRTHSFGQWPLCNEKHVKFVGLHAKAMFIRSLVWVESDWVKWLPLALWLIQDFIPISQGVCGATTTHQSRKWAKMLWQKCQKKQPNSFQAWLAHSPTAPRPSFWQDTWRY